MSDLFSVIWAVFVVIAIVSSVKKKNQKRQSAVPPLTAQPVNRSARSATRQPQPIVTSDAGKWLSEPAKFEQVSTMPAQPPKPAPAVAAPRVHTHLAPDCDMDEPSGSMDFISTEGVDPCHDDDLPDRQEPRPIFQNTREQPGLTLEWTSDALVRSVIMQEVLTRPCQRRRR